MKDFTPEERASVSAAIRAAEKSTQAEILVVAAEQSDDYLHVPLHIATLLALVFPFLLAMFSTMTMPLLWVFGGQLLVFIIASLGLSLPSLRFMVTPKSLMHKYAHGQAAAQFLGLNAHMTKGRTGVLIFISRRERYCEILTDRSVAERIAPAQWQFIMEQMRHAFRSGRVAEGLIVAVEQMGEMLAKEFPAGVHNPNELPDHFITIS